MKLRYYTDSELKTLESNIFVKEIQYKRKIEYDTLFKLWCIMMRFDCPELTAKQIFERAGFDCSILSDTLPYRRIGEWLKQYKRYGINYFLPELEPYCSKGITKKEIKEDTFKLKLLQTVLKRLKEIENEKVG